MLWLLNLLGVTRRTSWPVAIFQMRKHHRSHVEMIAPGCVLAERLQLRAGLRVPKEDPAADAIRGGEEPAIRRECDGGHVGIVAIEAMQHPAGGEIPQVGGTLRVSVLIFLSGQ